MQLPGIGPKTASWAVRNWLESDEVAILDIHVIRAGILMKIFSPNHRPERNYLAMERRFLDLAMALNAKAGNLDALIWQQMRSTPLIVNTCLAYGEPGNSTPGYINPQRRPTKPFQLPLL